MKRLFIIVGFLLGESAAMATAQMKRRVPFGLNTGDNAKQQFMLNVMHRLVRQF